MSNLETGKSPMTKLQYLALRTVFSAEIARREDRDLARIIKTLVDDPLSNAFANGALKSRTRGRCRHAPVIRTWQRADNAATEKRKPSAATLAAITVPAQAAPTRLPTSAGAGGIRLVCKPTGVR